MMMIKKDLTTTNRKDKQKKTANQTKVDFFYLSHIDDD